MTEHEIHSPDNEDYAAVNSESTANDVAGGMRSGTDSTLQPLPELTDSEVNVIMQRVCNIDTPNIGFHGVRTKFDIAGVFEHGLVPNGVDHRDHQQTEVDMDEVARHRVERKTRSEINNDKGSVDFNITGRTRNLSRNENNGRCEVGRSSYTCHGNVIILVDLSDFTEVPPAVESRELQRMQFKAGDYNLGSIPMSIDPKNFIRERHAYWYNTSGQLLANEDEGFITPDGIATEHFMGVVFDAKVEKTPREVTGEAQVMMRGFERDYEKAVNKSEPNAEEKRPKDLAYYEAWVRADSLYKEEKETRPEVLLQRAEKIAETMRRVYGDDATKLLPIYDTDGNLWWPKQVSRGHIKTRLDEYRTPIDDSQAGS